MNKIAEQDGNVALIAGGLTSEQRRLICRNGRYFTTEEAMSLPMANVVTRAGGFNRWQRTELGHRIVRSLRRNGDKE